MEMDLVSIIIVSFVFYSAFFIIPYYALRYYFDKKHRCFYYDDDANRFSSKLEWDWPFGSSQECFLSDDKENKRLSLRIAAYIGVTFFFFHDAIFASTGALIDRLPFTALINTVQHGLVANLEGFLAIFFYGAWIFFTFSLLEKTRNHLHYLDQLRNEFEQDKKKFIKDKRAYFYE